MYARVMTGALVGLDAELVTVETDLSAGLPGVTIVGLPDASVREAKERIRTAVANAGFPFPMKRITINLSPADNKKGGTHFDLPIAVGVMVASGVISAIELEDTALIGELLLDGRLCAVRGALPLAIGLRDRGIKRLILPLGNAAEVSVLEDIEIYAASTLAEAAAHLAGTDRLRSYGGRPRKSPAQIRCAAGDFADVAGQESGKRALQIAAAAAHNALLIGPPGAGKTMLARRLPGILPSMTYAEKLEVTKIYSVCGETREGDGLMEQRPFRAPHHTISPIALVGGGVKAHPGEISLAHGGVLFLDELPEFQRRVLEVLRQPMEDARVTISRASTIVTFPSRFMLIAAMNPCPCGYLGDNRHPCTCTEHQIRQYQSRISGPLTDRIDLCVEVFPVGYEDLEEERRASVNGKDSMTMRAEVEAAREIQLARYRLDGILVNAQLTPALIKKYCRLDPAGKDLLQAAFEHYGLSARAYQRVLKVARTIADLEGAEMIEANHLAEALRYRTKKQEAGER